MRVASALLPLHGGQASKWLFWRMRELSKGICGALSREFGSRELLKRLSDPLWFQSLSMVLGFDWHSSGCTTVTCGALKESLSICGDFKRKKHCGRVEALFGGFAKRCASRISEKLASTRRRACELRALARSIRR